MIQRVVVTLTAVADPQAASEREPVVPGPARTNVSVVIEIVTTPAEQSLTKVTAVPTGKATELLAGIVHIRAVVSAEGW